MINLKRINKNDMFSFSNILPGYSVKSILVYFPNVKKYKVLERSKVSNQIKYGTYQFEIGGELFEDSPSYWIELEV